MGEVYTLLVAVGRKPGDGLPEAATGATLLCYAAGTDEAEAVRETVALLKAADMAPLDVTGYGTLAERGEVSDGRAGADGAGGRGERRGGGRGHAELRLRGRGRWLCPATERAGGGAFSSANPGTEE